MAATKIAPSGAFAAGGNTYVFVLIMAQAANGAAELYVHDIGLQGTLPVAILKWFNVIAGGGGGFFTRAVFHRMYLATGTVGLVYTSGANNTIYIDVAECTFDTQLVGNCCEFASCVQIRCHENLAFGQTAPVFVLDPGASLPSGQPPSLAVYNNRLLGVATGKSALVSLYAGAANTHYDMIQINDNVVTDAQWVYIIDAAASSTNTMQISSLTVHHNAARTSAFFQNTQGITVTLSSFRY